MDSYWSLGVLHKVYTAKERFLQELFMAFLEILFSIVFPFLGVPVGIALSVSLSLDDR